MKFRVKDTTLVVAIKGERVHIGPGETVDVPEEVGMRNPHLEPVASISPSMRTPVRLPDPTRGPRGPQSHDSGKVAPLPSLEPGPAYRGSRSRPSKGHAAR